MKQKRERCNQLFHGITLYPAKIKTNQIYFKEKNLQSAIAATTKKIREHTFADSIHYTHNSY